MSALSPGQTNKKPKPNKNKYFRIFDEKKSTSPLTKKKKTEKVSKTFLSSDFFYFFVTKLIQTLEAKN